MNHKQTRPAHKALALALALLLLFSALPLQAFATDLTPVGGQPADEQVLSSADGRPYGLRFGCAGYGHRRAAGAAAV